jgi:hypothetical protein
MVPGTSRQIPGLFEHRKLKAVIVFDVDRGETEEEAIPPLLEEAVGLLYGSRSLQDAITAVNAIAKNSIKILIYLSIKSLHDSFLRYPLL